MSFTKVQREIGVSLHALESIGKIAKTALPVGAQGRAEQAISIVSLISKIYDAVSAGLDTGADVGDIERELARLTAGGKANQDAFRDALDAELPEKP